MSTQRKQKIRDPQTTVLSPEFNVVKIIGRGTFGSVFEAKTKNGMRYAIKKVLQDPRFKNRELDILQNIRHPNCMRLYSSFYTREGENNSVYLHLVSDLFPMDLSHLMKTTKFIQPMHIKVFSFQLFQALSYLHSISICHRDIKPNNILVNPETGSLQLCDFGSAKFLSSVESNVSYIATRSYRAPELLFGSTSYDTSIDVWALGCVIAEMANQGRVIFDGDSNEDLIDSITKVIGSPKKTDLENMRGSIAYSGARRKRKPISTLFKDNVDVHLLDLLERIFVFSPNERLSADKCLMHPYFQDLRPVSEALYCYQQLY